MNKPSIAVIARQQPPRDYPAYPKPNPSYKCNTKLIPMTAVKYQPNPGFTGTDSLELQTNFTGSLSAPDKTAITVEVARYSVLRFGGITKNRKDASNQRVRAK